MTPETKGREVRVVRARLEGSGSYVVPVEEVETVLDELRLHAEDGGYAATFTVEFGTMAKEAYENLPEFGGW